MFNYKIEFSAIFLGVMLSCAGIAIADEGFKSSEFLNYSESTQKNYITISAGMAGVIATQNNKSQASCIDRWISENDGNGYLSVIEAMRKYPNYHPQIMIIAVLKKACGNFKY